MRIALALSLVCAFAGRARADGYCDHVNAVASADAAMLYMPELFGSLGFVEEPQSGAVDQSDDGLRVIAGVRYSIGDLLEASAVKKRAKADCKRHEALESVDGVTTYRALAARAKVLDDAVIEAEKLLDDASADLKNRRATAQEVDATRLRVDALRALAAETHTELDALPAPAEGTTIAGALGDYYRADAEVEEQEASLRSARGWDLSVRVGYDKFLDLEDDQPFFALVTATIDLGWLVSGGANKRAAEARKRAVREDGSAAGDTTAARLKALLDRETTRAEETAILVEDLEKQLRTLKKLGGDEGRRYRETVWFEWVKASAEHAYLTEHVASLKEILGEEADK